MREMYAKRRNFFVRWDDARLRRPIDLWHFLEITSKWFPKVKWLSRVTPSNLTVLDGLIEMSLILTVKSSGIFLLGALKTISCVILDTFMERSKDSQ